MSFLNKIMGSIEKVIPQEKWVDKTGHNWTKEEVNKSLDHIKEIYGPDVLSHVNKFSAFKAIGNTLINSIAGKPMDPIASDLFNAIGDRYTNTDEWGQDGESSKGAPFKAARNIVDLFNNYEKKYDLFDKEGETVVKDILGKDGQERYKQSYLEEYGILPGIDQPPKAEGWSYVDGSWVSN